MADIVERLRKSADEMGCFPHPDCGHLDRAEHAMRDAAAEILRLREANRCLDAARTLLIPELQAANDGLRSELEAAKKDAGRYRWHRDGELGPVPHNDDFPMAITSSTRRHLWREELDVAVDASMGRA